MLLLVHIFIALSSLVLGSYLYIKPSKNKLVASYFLVGSTFISGTALVISSNASLVKACVTGLIYLGFISTLIILARSKLAQVTQKIRD